MEGRLAYSVCKVFLTYKVEVYIKSASNFPVKGNKTLKLSMKMVLDI